MTLIKQKEVLDWYEANPELLNRFLSILSNPELHYNEEQFIVWLQDEYENR